ncbi:hypothetical protein GH714_026226 [Hevea brasiliensis]|uniref:Uncharacterized protein n=1 Tax=Hevea brasiliensis TaxID=3981 RepID=A0A6A6KVG6_HEVBR|nr:hypothetical protein GH714_026034 [Hevea brasiliensis]KAF2292641.1 hypothetical protein GH714_026226 [Hevea brasiliensis]
MDTRTSSAALRDKSDNNRKDPAWKCPAHVREEIQDYMLKEVAAMDFDKTSFPDFEDVKRMDDDEDKNEISANIEVSQQGSNKVANMRKKPMTKGPIDVFFAQNVERAEKDRKNAKLK